MKLSKQGIELLKQLEGVQLRVYNDVAGYPTIGIGHLITKAERSSGKIRSSHGFVSIRENRHITTEQAEQILAADLVPYEETMSRYFNRGFKQNQFDALVIFAFNVGIDAFVKSTLFSKHLAGDTAGAAEQFGRWVYAGGKKIRGLETRRAIEARLYANGLYGFTPGVSDNG